MISISQGQRILGFSQRSKKNNASGVLIAVALLGVFLSASARAAIFTVNSTSDVVDAAPLNDGICATAYNNGVPNGVCTLRAAIMEANHTPGGPHTISLPPGLYALNIPASGADDETTGDLNITASMSIIGAGSSTTIIDANHNVTVGRVFTIGSATVNISGVTIRNGHTSRKAGGGIVNEGTLTLTNSTVSGNSAEQDNAGGIFTSGTLTLVNSTVSGNGADGAGGGIFNTLIGRLTLTNSTVSENSGGGSGGGIASSPGALMTVANSTVSGNSGTHGGGGIENSAGTLTLTNSTVSGNRADLGDGGGILDTGTSTLTNSTVSGNRAGGGGGGISPFGNVNIFSSTITGNTAGAGTGTGFGGGIANVSSRSTITFQNTILAGNHDEMIILGHTFFQNDDCSGTIFSNGHNLMGVQNCTVSGFAPILADPNLGPLQNNGGPTQTHALLAGSPAIDAGDPDGCRDNLGALLTTDQRGFRRTVDGNGDGTARCDIGAVEFIKGTKITYDLDFDGDGRNDIGVYRDGTWFIRRSVDGGVTATGWGGSPQDIPVPGDYDGDGKTDVAVYRDGAVSSTQALWFIKRSSDGATSVVQWGGLLQDIPVPGDYDGDGKTDTAVYRDGTWFIRRSFDGGVTTTGWGGLPQDVPVPADYDGDGRTDLAVYRDGTWFILLSRGGVIATGWGGLSQDIPVPADYDGDGKTDLAVYRDGEWFILRSSDGRQSRVGWGGLSQDVPVPADYDGDGKADVAVYRDGNWFVLQSSNGGVTTTGWGGLPQDIPLNRRSD